MFKHWVTAMWWFDLLMRNIGQKRVGVDIGQRGWHGGDVWGWVPSPSSDEWHFGMQNSNETLEKENPLFIKGIIFCNILFFMKETCHLMSSCYLCVHDYSFSFSKNKHPLLTFMSLFKMILFQLTFEKETVI